MREINPVDRQATFNTELVASDVLLNKNLHRGSIRIPVVRDSDVKVNPRLNQSISNTRDTSDTGQSEEVVTEARHSLSLSVRKKLRKKPRIRVPQLDFITQEPTITEETSQDLLTVPTEEKAYHQDLTPRSIRPDTVIVANPKLQKSDSLSLIPRNVHGERKKQNNEVTIVEFPRLNKYRPNETNSGNLNTKSDKDHTTANGKRVDNNSIYDRTETKVNLSQSVQNRLENNYLKENNLYRKHNYLLSKTKLELDKNTEILLGSNKQLTETNKSERVETLSVGMAGSRSYGNEHETFEEVLQERNALTKSEKTYHKRIRQLEDELKAMVIQCQTLSDENKELRQMLDSIKRENPDDKKKLDALLVENSDLKSQNEEFRKRISTIERQLTLKAENESQVSELEYKNEELESKVKELQKENSNFRLKITSLEDRNQIISTTLEEKRKELNEMMRTMKTMSTIEAKLKESTHKLEEAEREIERVKHDLGETNHVLKNSEQSKEKLKEHIAEKEREIAKMKTDREMDHKTIADLRSSLDKSANEVKKYERKKQSETDLEREIADLKAKVVSLKTEMDGTVNENVKLKQEREEMNRQIERLNDVCSTNANAASDSKKYFKKWEAERDHRVKAELEVTQKEKEARNIEKRLTEAGQTIDELQQKIHALEEENGKLKAMDINGLDSDNKTLKNENKKLRQMLVEKNIELTNKKAKLENEQGEGQILFLERKSKFAKVGVQKVSAWSTDENESRDKRKGHSVTFATDNHLLGNKSKSRNTGLQHHQDIHSADVSPRGPTKKNTRASAREGVDEGETNRSMINLPLIDTDISEHQVGYFNLYKEKLKRMKDRRY